MAPYFLSSLLILSVLTATDSAGIVNWDHNGGEDSLSNACNSGNYQYINVASLTTFGNGRTPVLNLAGHSNPAVISDDIRACQARGIKVLLSLRGSKSSLSSAADVAEVADYLWNSFLGGSSASRPLGNAVLDGVDFDIESGAGDELSWVLSAFSQQRKGYFSAAAQCPRQDDVANLDSAIETGLFDYIIVRYYYYPQCDYYKFMMVEDGDSEVKKYMIIYSYQTSPTTVYQNFYFILIFIYFLLISVYYCSRLKLK